MKKKIVKVRRHERSDGSVVEAHDRTIDISEPKSLSEYIKKKKREQEQVNLLESLREEK